VVPEEAGQAGEGRETEEDAENEADLFESEPSSTSEVQL